MSTALPSSDLLPIANTSYVRSDDVLFLRREVFADGIISRNEMAQLLELAERAPAGDREWASFFEEAGADYFLNQAEPEGYLTQEEFTWLQDQVTRQRTKISFLELGLFMKLLEKAIATPDAMHVFIREQLKAHILEKTDGPVISKEDADMARRFLFAAGGDGNIAVTRDEAEFLFDLNDAAKNALNDPAWEDLFKKAVANSLMAHIGYKPLGRAAALNASGFLKGEKKPAPEPMGLWDRVKTLWKSPDEAVEARYKLANEMNTSQASEAEKISAEEADWLADRINKDGVLAPFEKALITHLRSLDAELPPKLKALVGDDEAA